MTRIISFAFVLLFLCMACGKKETGREPLPDIAFDKTKWSTRDEDGYTYRRQMITGLLHHRQWTGVTKDSVLQMLGAPDDIEAEVIMMYYYEQEPALFGIMSSHKAFSIELAPGDTVKTAKLSEGTGWH